jgi:hypothetical protein
MVCVIIIVVDAVSATPGVIPAVMVTELADVLVNTARPTLAADDVGTVYRAASELPNCCGATSWS